MEHKKPVKISRRRFVGSTGKLVLGIAGVEAAAGGLFYLGAQSGKGQQAEQSREKPGNIVLLGDKTQLDNITDVEKLEYNAEIQDGWVTQSRNGFVYVTKNKQNELLILSPVCSHLGCTVGLATEEEKKGKAALYFRCPCHGGEFDSSGKNIGGPPPRPMDVFEPMEREGKVYIDIFKPVKRG